MQLFSVVLQKMSILHEICQLAAAKNIREIYSFRNCLHNFFLFLQSHVPDRSTDDLALWFKRRDVL